MEKYFHKINLVLFYSFIKIFHTFSTSIFKIFEHIADYILLRHSSRYYRKKIFLFDCLEYDGDLLSEERLKFD